MKYVLLWVILGTNGAVSSGSAELETSKACQAGRNAIEEVATRAARTLDKQPRVSTNCIEKATGERGQ